MSDKTYTIKPLEWKDTGYGYITAYVMDGRYDIHEYKKDEWVCICSGYRESSPSLEAAQQAAQSHWEERLKGALEEVLR